MVAPLCELRASVVIPTYRRVPLLMRCLQALHQQVFDAQSFDVWVVDDGHCDETRRAVANWAAAHPLPVVHYLRPRRGRGPAVARNGGWRHARAPVIAFTDDDTVPLRDWLDRGVWAMELTDAAAVAGHVQVPVPPRPTDHERMTQGLEKAEFVTANAFVRRDALERVGGFDERFTRAWREDSDLQFRLMEVGVVGWYARAEVVHPVRQERWGISLRQQRNVFFDALLYKKHPQLYRERVMPRPPWGYYLMVALTVLTLWWAATGWVVAAQLAAAGVLGGVLSFAWRRLRGASHAPAHVLEMVVTSALIPFLSVYWRLRGALHFRVLYW